MKKTDAISTANTSSSLGSASLGIFFELSALGGSGSDFEGIQIKCRPVDELNYADTEELTVLALKLCSYGQLLLETQIAQAW